MSEYVKSRMPEYEDIVAFRKMLLEEALDEFLAWAWSKTEFHKEYEAAGFPVSFEDWVTITYWGEVE